MRTEIDLRALNMPKIPQRLFISILLATLVEGCSKSEEASTTNLETEKRIAVYAKTLKSETIIGKTKTFGIFESAEEVQINVEFAATIQKILVHEGERVSQGQDLAILSTDKLVLQKEQTKQNIIQANSQLESVASNYQRLQQLAEQQTISKQQLEDAALKVNSAKAVVKQLEAQLKLIDRDINNSVVRSPIAGLISERKVEAGTALSSMQPILTIEADGMLRVSTYISESELPYMRTGNHADIITAVGDFTSTIYSISAKADPSTGNFEVKLVLDNQQGLLRPGMTAKVRLTTIPIEDQIIIPEDALSFYKGRHVVYVIKEGKAERRFVNISLGFEDSLLVKQGLDNGEAIATRHVDLLTDGSLVE